MVRGARSRQREIAAIFITAAAIFLTVSLLSYDPAARAPGAIGGASRPMVSNYGGLAGHHLARSMVWAVGSVALAFPAILLLCSYRLLRPLSGQSATLLAVSSLALCASLSALLMVSFSAEPVFPGLPPGGRAGRIIGGFFLSYFSLAGSLIILISIAVASFISMTSLSIYYLLYLLGLVRLTWRLWDKLAWAFERAMASYSERREAAGDYQRPRWLDELPRHVAIGGESSVRALDAIAPRSGPAQTLSKTVGDYQMPSLSLLDDPSPFGKKAAKEDLTANADLLERKLRDFGVEGGVVQVLPGPVVTTYEFEPASGVKVNRIINLADDLALGMKALSVRIIAPVPGKSVVGIEIPNRHREPVCLKEVLASEEFMDSGSKLTIALGKDILGRPTLTDLSQIPHLLIAGATGSGKSVSLHSMICSLLFKFTPEDVKLLLIDTKMMEFSVYDGIPHLLSPVVTDPKRASAVLRVVLDEMESRNRLLAANGVRNIEGFNKVLAESPSLAMPHSEFGPEMGEEGRERPQSSKLPYIVVVIDELADLMMVSSHDVEDSIARLAQMARAAGIHLLLATQRPSVDVLTGVIKANFPARISFQLSSRTDSRTILDTSGAERLLGKGDLLFLPPGTSRLQRIHGAYVSEAEIKRLVEHLKEQRRPDYDSSFSSLGREAGEDGADEEKDEKYDEAVDLVRRYGQASISMIQRRLRVGYNRAARMIEMMEHEGIIGPSEGIKPRRINPPLN